MFTTHDRVDIYQKWIRLIFISFKLSWRRGRRPRRPAPSMRGISFHFLELLPVLHNLCLNCGNRPHFRDKFSPQKRTLIFGSTQVPVFQDIAFIGTSVPRHRGVLRKDAVPYILLIGMPRIIGTSRTPSPTICLSECRGLSGRQHLASSACFARTPSPTIRLSECRGLSGRLHLVTSACFARTPSLTFSSYLPNKFRIAE